jgi:hypothetical protein
VRRVLVKEYAAMLNGKAEYPNAKQLTESLKGEWNAFRHSGRCRCPAHADENPSLDITDKNGRALVICRAGCSQDAVFDALRCGGHWPERNAKANGHARQSNHIVATYDYVNEAGELIFQAVRYGPVKSFSQRRPNGRGGWIDNLPLEPRDRFLPYRLLELLEAIANGQPVFVLEGEKDTDNGRGKLGITATCNAGGAGKWKPQHAAYLKGADVIVIPDNDDAGRRHAESVAASLAGIAKRVRVFTLSDLPEKGDLSDWIEAGGTAYQLWALVEQAPNWQAPADNASKANVDPELDELNSKYAVARIGGKTRIVFMEESPGHSGCLVPVYSTLPDFRAFHDKRRKNITEDDGTKKRIGLGTWWVRHEQRRQYERIVFDPGAEPNPNVLNLWRGFAVEPDDSGDCSLYLAHITDVICSGNDEYGTYLLDYLAWGVQNPAKRPEVATVLRGQEGTGKGTMIHPYGQLFGAHYQHISQPGHLVGHFNAHLQQTRVLFADEAFFAGDRRHDGVLKAYITEPQIKIEPKGVDAFTVPNLLMIFMASNNEWVVPAGANARRYFVLDVAETRMQDHGYFEAIARQLDSGGRAALLHHLLNRDLTDFNIRAIPHTQALAEQKARSRRGVDLLVELLAADGVLPSAHPSYPNIAITTGEEKGEGFWPAARTLVPSLKHESSRVIGATLKKDWNCEPWESHGRSGLKFAPLDQLRLTFDKRHGTQNWDSGRKRWGENVSEA